MPWHASRIKTNKKKKWGKEKRKTYFLVLPRSKKQPLKCDGWELLREEVVKPVLTSVSFISGETVTLFELDTDFSLTEVMR